LLDEAIALVQPTLAKARLSIGIYTPADKPITLTAESQDSTLIIRVADQRPGLPVEVLPRIFDKFFQPTNSLPGGGGLGLSIARGFVEAVDGTLKAFKGQCNRQGCRPRRERGRLHHQALPQ
jgi:two-component system sensor histidine kinase KdpD